LTSLLREKECKAAFERLRAAKRSVYSCWDTDEDDEAGYLVSGSELERWMIAEIDPPKKKKPAASSRTQSDRYATSTDDDDSVYVVATPTVRSVPPHKPPSRSKADVQNGSPKKNLYTPMEIDGSGDDEDLPTLSIPSKRSASASAPPDRPRSSISGASTSASRSTSASLPNAANERTSEKDKQFDPQTEKSITPQSARGVVSVTKLDSSALLCNHDKVDPRYISKVKYISQVSAFQIWDDLLAEMSLAERSRRSGKSRRHFRT
jgi:hypothetical protein